MNKLEFAIELQKHCPWITENTLLQFECYRKCVQKYNAQMNLSRIVNDDLIYSQYFFSSLLPYIKLEYFNNNEINYKVLDIGTGSGIPGVVLKILFPNIKLTLIESNAKKCNFLKILLDELNFHDVVIINDRCENQSTIFSEHFDIVTSRAVTQLNKILELSAQFAKINGSIICLKSQNIDSELKEAHGAIKTLDLKLNQQIEYYFDDHFYCVLDFIKIKSTDKKYPRLWNQIVNKPL